MCLEHFPELGIFVWDAPQLASHSFICILERLFLFGWFRDDFNSSTGKGSNIFASSKQQSNGQSEMFPLVRIRYVQRLGSTIVLENRRPIFRKTPWLLRRWTREKSIQSLKDTGHQNLTNCAPIFITEGFRMIVKFGDDAGKTQVKILWWWWLLVWANFLWLAL